MSEPSQPELPTQALKAKLELYWPDFTRGDAKAVHEIRKLTRRVAAAGAVAKASKIGGWKGKERRAWRDVRRAAAPIRDHDASGEHLRAALLELAASQADRDDFERLWPIRRAALMQLADLPQDPPPLPTLPADWQDVAAQELRRGAANLLEAGHELFAAQQEAEKEKVDNELWHEWRKSMKRWRYTAELTGKAPKAMREMLEHLGRIQDAEVLLGLLESRPDLLPSVREPLQDRERTAEAEAKAAAAALWPKLQRQLSQAAKHELGAAGRTIEGMTVDAPTPQHALLLHAFPLDSRMWAAQKDMLEERGLKVIAPDLAGFGGAEGKISSLEETAEWLVDEVLPPAPTVLLGLSMGGYLALEVLHLLQQRGDTQRVPQLVLADTHARGDTADKKADREKQAKKVLAEGVEFMIEAAQEEQRPATAKQTAAMTRDASPEGIAAALRAMAARADRREVLRQAAGHGTQVLALVGSQDDLTPPDLARENAQLSGGQLRLIEGAGHLSNLDQPAAFNAALAEFLEG